MAYIDDYAMKYENAWAGSANSAYEKDEGWKAHYFATMAVAAELHEQNRLASDQNLMLRDILTYLTSPRIISSNKMEIAP